MEANNKEKIKRCLTCPVGHRVIGDFFSLYPVWVGQQKERHKATDDENDYIHSLASSISSTLLLHSTPSNNLDFIISFAESYKKFDKNIKKSNLAHIDNSCCLYALNNILYPIKVILEEQTDYNGESIRDELSKKAIDIILIMNEVLEDNALFTDFDLTTEEKRWTKEYRGSLSLEQAKEIYKKLRAILSKYCLTPEKNIKYKYCNPIYSNKTTEIEYKGQVYRSCQSEDFEKYINSIKSYYSIDSDWKGLTDNNVRIIQQYLIDSPKRFGALLTRVMDYQGLTSQKIVKIWNVKKNASAVDRLKKDVKHELTETELSLLLRILLVSKNVLKNGNGKIYGNWNDILETPRDSEDWTMLQKAYNSDKFTELTQEVNNDISKFISQYKDVESMAKENTNFFTENSYSVYFDEDQGYDYQAMYDDMLEPNSYQILLSVLKKLQDTTTTE